MFIGTLEVFGTKCMRGPVVCRKIQRTKKHTNKDLNEFHYLFTP